MIFGLTDICLFTQGNARKYDFDFFIEKKSSLLKITLPLSIGEYCSNTKPYT